MSRTGKGEITTTPDDSQVEVHTTKYRNGIWGDADPNFWSKAFQWHPCDVVIAGNDVNVTSYISNLHPILHADLYSIIEKFFAKSIPLWGLTLTSTYRGRKAGILMIILTTTTPHRLGPETSSSAIQRIG